MGDQYQRPAVLHIQTHRQRSAMSHPTRHRITQALQEPATISELSRRLATNKGNIAHHLRVLVDAGIVRRVGERVGRGGTGILYTVAADSLTFDGVEVTSGMVGLIGEALSRDCSGFACLRTIAMSPTRARQLAEFLDNFVHDVPDEPGTSRRHVFVSIACA